MSGVGENGEVSRFVSADELFAGRHFDAEIVVLCVRWYLSFKLSFRDLVSMMNERGIRLAHTTILRWVQHYTPEFEKRRKRYARPVGGAWRTDETYVKVRGEWGLPVPSRRQSGPNRGLLFESATGHQRGQNLSTQGDEGATGSNQGDARCLRGLASRGG